MEIGALSRDYTVRRLEENDVEQIYTLCCGNGIFYRYHPPFVTRESVREDLRALPPGRSMEDKYCVGFFAGDILVAWMDLILRYPAEDTAYIGLFMTDARYQGRGIGSGILGEVCGCLRAAGFSRVRLGVDKGNPQSFSFWTKNGFGILDEDMYIRMERRL